MLLVLSEKTAQKLILVWD